jgi:cobyrinic acid a,c-diamide synthase
MIIPRLAVGAIQPDDDATLVVWGLLSLLERVGLQTQAFRHEATFVPWDGCLPITGREQRHLDSWLMPRDLCCQLFQRNACDADLSVIEGRYDAARHHLAGGSLDTLCQWLDVPRVVVLDAARLERCQLPVCPPFAVDAVLLDNVQSAAQVAKWGTTLEVLWGAPVLGALDAVPQLRAAAAALPRGSRPPAALCQELGERFRNHCHLAKLLNLACRPFDSMLATAAQARTGASRARLRVAVAFDESFHCYFPDTLDCLEAQGMELRLFSPLRSAELPPGTDVVYLGCGRIDRYAAELAANHCLKQALERFAASGGRVYGESAGLAYLCRHIVKDGRRYPMVGALSAVAAMESLSEPLVPTTVHLRCNSWLGEALQPLRGYLNSTWRLSPWGDVSDLAMEPEHHGDLVSQRNVIASRLHLNFAAQPSVLERFAQPVRTSTALA